MAAFDGWLCLYGKDSDAVQVIDEQNIGTLPNALSYGLVLLVAFPVRLYIYIYLYVILLLDGVGFAWKPASL